MTIRGVRFGIGQLVMTFSSFNYLAVSICNYFVVNCNFRYCFAMRILLSSFSTKYGAFLLEVFSTVGTGITLSIFNCCAALMCLLLYALL
jgi:hypothetical protein